MVRHRAQAWPPATLDRRGFLEGLAGLGAVALATGAGCGGTPSEAPAIAGTRGGWLSAHGRADADPGLVIAGPDFDPRIVPTGFRGHDVAVRPGGAGQAAIFGRRPGGQSAVVDLRAGVVQARLQAPDGMAFQGHGFFTPDGALLVTSEASLQTAEGRLGLWETEGFRRIGTLDTFGIGPHEIALMADADTVVVANGGLLTRPETGAQVLNLDTMDSNLTYLSLDGGALLEQQRAPESKASLRHFDVAGDGSVVIGMQVQRDALDHEEPLALAAVHRRGAPLRLLEGAVELLPAMQDYVGSVAVCDSMRTAGFSSPRGDLVLFWNIDDGQPAGHHVLTDCSGLATSPDDSAFVLSSSSGEVRTLRTTDLSEVVADRRRFDDVKWDNHLLAVSREDLG